MLEQKAVARKVQLVNNFAAFGEQTGPFWPQKI